jgi:hypothetical protein
MQLNNLTSFTILEFNPEVSRTQAMTFNYVHEDNVPLLNFILFVFCLNPKFSYV